MSVNVKDNNKHKDSLEEIIDEQCQKLHELDVATALIKGKHNVKDELQRMCEEMLQVSCCIGSLTTTLEQMKADNNRLTELLSLTEALNKRILHLKATVPTELIEGYQNANKQQQQSNLPTASVPEIIISPELDCNVNLHYYSELQTPSCYNSNTEKQSAVKDCKRTLFHEPEVCPTIPLITVQEFNKVPKYIIGRQTLEAINHLINTINQTLIAKYTILSLGKAGAQKKGEINMYLHFKKQELDIQEQNAYFFTAEDYYWQTKTKIDKTKLNLITALRHCKRLREYRAKNELRYIIISN